MSHIRRIFFVLLSFILLPQILWAEVDGTAAEVVPSKNRPLEKSYFQWGIHALLWQEYIAAHRGTDTEQMLVQTQGFGLGLTYRKPSSSIRWWQSHEFDLDFGNVHTTGTSATIPDTLRQQQWYSATFSPGFIYRTTAVSDIGMGVPLTYRVINWVTNDPTLTLDRHTSFSYGLSAIYINRLSHTSTLQLSFADQMSWKAFVWSLGWTHVF